LDNHLHIVCLDVPYPPDYGGVFDLYYKIEALYQKGVKIHLHCFEYGRGTQYALNRYCVEVNYYRRRTNIKALLQGIPHIVGSRASKSLLANLSKDDHPILLEGIHCTWFLFKNKLLDKKVFVRLHNVEFQYYRQLAKVETSIFKKLYFFTESMLLKKYEKKIAAKALCIAVTTKDQELYKSIFLSPGTKYLPVFVPYTSVDSIPGNGEFCLYHGNLSVVENEKAVIWLLKNVFNDPAIPFIIAGKDPSVKLAKLVKNKTAVSIVANPTEETLESLIRGAHINILPSFNATGIKIKLINALFNGRHCLVNKEAISGTDLESLCSVAGDPKDFINAMSVLISKPFMQEDIELRSGILQSKFDNERNAEQLMQWIY
jgi:hypothetical protein